MEHDGAMNGYYRIIHLTTHALTENCEIVDDHDDCQKFQNPDHG